MPKEVQAKSKARQSREMLRRRILFELDNRGRKPITRVDLRDLLALRWGVKHPTFYKALAEMKKNELIEMTGKKGAVSLTDLGKQALEQTQLWEGRPSAFEDWIVLRSKIESKLDEIKTDVHSFASIDSIPYIQRRRVWDSLARLYDDVEKEYWILAQGADLEEKTTQEDIRLLLEKMRECIKRGKVLRRIQPINTWLNWLKFLKELLIDEKGDVRNNFELFFMEDQPAFITQVNIRDAHEIILVPLEKGSASTYGIHILKEKIVKGHKADFEKLLRKCQGPLYSPEILDVLITNLRKFRELQTQCLAIYEIERQRMHYSGIDRFSFLLSYEEVQEYFPLDYSLWEIWLKEWFASEGTEYLQKYCRTERHDSLKDALGNVFENKHTLTSDEEGHIKLFAKENTPAIASDAFADPVLNLILQRENVSRASKELILHISRYCIPYLLTTALRSE